MSGPLEAIKSSLPDWPDWAINLLLSMTACLGVTFLISNLFTSEEDNKDTKEEENHKNSNGKSMDQLKSEFSTFRNKYLVVYLVIMLADWMQGTHMYTLYLSYNVNISALFLTGFLSGAIFAPFLGSAVDKFGRKNSCIAYCVLEIIINILEHFHDFNTLILGRVLGGISTNLLFSAFESWMTTQHRINGFPEVWLEKTYAATSIGNGTMAILAGIVAQLLEDKLGHIGPFQGAVALTVLALLLILTWEENYGEAKEGDHESSSLYTQFTQGWKATCTDSNIWRIGLTQALSEGAMYTFVFMWVPTLLSMDPPGGVPTGCVFSSLMIAITMGGLFFPVMHNFVSKSLTNSKIEEKSYEVTAVITYALASISMAVPALCLAGVSTANICFEKALISFVIVEFSVGLFNPVAGTLRSKYVPDNLQGGILNIFRLPLNAVVVAGTHATDVFPAHKVFMLVSGCFMAAAIIQSTMIISPGKKKVD
jgi:MFS family permease